MMDIMPRTIFSGKNLIERGSSLTTNAITHTDVEIAFETPLSEFKSNVIKGAGAT
jgi:hypothetical protein